MSTNNADPIVEVLAEHEFWWPHYRCKCGWGGGALHGQHPYHVATKIRERLGHPLHAVDREAVLIEAMQFVLAERDEDDGEEASRGMTNAAALLALLATGYDADPTHRGAVYYVDSAAGPVATIGDEHDPPCRWSEARSRWETTIRPGVSKEACGHRHSRDGRPTGGAA